MALRYAVATGNWSNPAIWNGGTLPGVGDQVHANTFTVTIDQDIDVEYISTANGAPAVQGGGFSLNSIPGGGRVLTCSAYGGSTPCLTVNAAGAITGLKTVQGGTLTNSFGMNILASLGLVTISAETINGSPGGVNGGHGITVGAGTSLDITADTIQGGGGTSIGVNASVSAGFSLTIDVNVIRGNYIGVQAARVSYITANEVYGGSLHVGLNIPTSVASSSFDLGRCEASTTSAAVTTTNAMTNMRVTGPIINAPNGRQALFVPYFMIKSDFTEIQMTDDSGDGAWGQPMRLSANVVNPPVPADVRAGTTFGVAGELTGTMAVPPAEAVSHDTPTGVEVGTASLPLEPLADVLEQQLISAGA